MHLSEFDYILPPELIAKEPLPDRTASRLLVLPRGGGEIRHQHFRDLLDCFHPGDALILNDTRVIPARLIAKRSTGGKVDILLLKEKGEGRWEALLKPLARIKEGEKLWIAEDFYAEVVSVFVTPAKAGVQSLAETLDSRFRGNDNTTKLRFHPPEKLKIYGMMPLPPYIKRKPEERDKETYQTVYARAEGAVAAPTAGLHFDQKFLDEILSRKVSIGFVTLHVGHGTFKPITEENFRTGKLHAEYFKVSAETAELFNQTRKASRRVFVCGTTTLRALESAKATDGSLAAREGETSLFIYPPYSITMADALITNFHLPKSSLLLLVSAFAGEERVQKAYKTAIQERYRFYSYGDAMLIL